MYGAAMLAPHAVAGSVDELARCVEDLGFKAAYLTPGLPDRRPWHDPVYDPIWAECVRLGVPICFHGGGKTYAQPDFAFGDILGPTTLWHPFNQPLGIMFVPPACRGGVLERFLELKVGLPGRQPSGPRTRRTGGRALEWLGRYETPDAAQAVGVPARAVLFSVEADEAPARRTSTIRGRQPRLLHRLPAPTWSSCAMESFLELPLPESSKQKIPLGELREVVRLPAEGPTR
jgi:hypothetical protein